MVLGQEPPFPDAATIADVLVRTLAPLRRAVADVERLAGALGDPAPDRDASAAAYDRVLEWALAHDAWDADRRAEVAAARLGLAELDPGRRVGTLSGGQRTRLALATIMTTRPTCLLLDEPTNHLDDAALEVLSGFLVDLPGVVLFTSHDRVFLDDVATDLVDLDPSAFGTDGEGGRRFGGGWTAYEEHRHDARRRWEEAYAAQQEELDALRAATRIGTGAIAHGRGPTDNDKFVHAFKGSRVDRTLARRKKDAGRRLEVAERDQVRKPPAPLRFGGRLTATGPAGRLVLVRDLVVDGRLDLDRLDVHAGEHLLVSGGNGTGKSTLLGVLAGRVARRPGHRPGGRTLGGGAGPGRRVRGARSQRAGDVRRPGRRRRPTARATWACSTRATTRRPVGALSVGQRRRLGLAVAVASGPDLLLLDEPTNHVSLALAGELEEAIGTSAGTVVVASHDRWLRRRWQGSGLVLG